MTPDMLGKPIVKLECSNCKAPLCEVIIANNEPPNQYRVHAECCFCGDKSFTKNIVGRLVYSSSEFAIATPYPKYKPREKLDDPYEPTDEIIVKTEPIKKWRK